MSASTPMFDVAVVGAGPGGTAAARAAASGGLSVVLVEKARPPRYKTCGGGVVARALGELPAGVERCFESRCTVAEMHLGAPGDASRSFVVERERPIVSMAMRAELDARLLEAAADTGAEVRCGAPVDAVRQDADGVTLTAGGREVRARSLVAADGATSRVAAALGSRALPPRAPAIEWELPASDADLRRFAGRARFDFGGIERGYAWVFPKRAHLSVGVVRMRPGRARLAEELQRYLERLRLPVAADTERHGWMIPLAPRPGGATLGRALLVGDAAGFADPLTGEGIGPALVSGRLAGEALARAIERGPRAVARAWARARRPLERELGLARLLARVLYARRRPEWLFERFGPELCEALTRVIEGRETYASVLARPAHWKRLIGLPRRRRAPAGVA